MDSKDKQFETFLDLSSALTGFERFHLRGTGQAENYFDTVQDLVGAEILSELLREFRAVSGDGDQDRDELEQGIRQTILSDAKLGPVARRVIKMWYVGVWYQLPKDWREAYGQNPQDRTFVVSPTAYTEGLLWPAIGANPPGAKPFGYGTWADPPRVEDK